MKKIFLAVGIAAVFVLGFLYFNRRAIVRGVDVISASDYKNIAYQIDGHSVKLANGAAEAPAAPGSAEKVVTKYFGNEVWGDFNGDGEQDVAFILTQSTGGSGTFFYEVAALGSVKGYVGTNAVLLGDRIAPQATGFGDGIITVNYADRAPGEAMTVAPSVGETLRLEVVDNGLVKI